MTGFSGQLENLINCYAFFFSLSPPFSLLFFSVHCIVNMVSRQSSPVICFCFFPFAVLPLLNDRFVLERLQLLQAETALHRRGGQFAS